MPRARISAGGIEVAKPGFDVDTAAIGDMQFSSALVAARIAKTGLVTPENYVGFYSESYKRAIVYLDDPVPYPPIVLVAGIRSDGTSDQAPFINRYVSGGTAYHEPYYEIRTFTDRFELYVLQVRGDVYPAPPNWRYWVFQNTVET